MRKLLTAFIWGLGVAATACAASSENGETSQENLTGSLATARACAVRDAYEAADLNAFPILATSDVPSAISTASAVALSKLDVAHVGIVYVVEDTHGTSFYAPSGTLLARVESSTWSSSAGPLTCDPVTPPPPPPPPPSGPVSCDTTSVCTTGSGSLDLGYVSGDTGADAVSATGYGSHWIKVTLGEDSIAATDLRLKATLTSPPGANFDLFLHAATCATPTSKSEKPAGEVDTATFSLPDSTLGASDNQFVLFEVRHIGTDTCDTNAKWTLKVEGNK